MKEPVTILDVLIGPVFHRSNDLTHGYISLKETRKYIKERRRLLKLKERKVK